MKFGVIVGFGPLMSFEFAKKLLDDHELLLIARNERKLQELAVQLGSDNVSFAAVDANNQEALIRIISEFKEGKGGLDLVHYHLGYGPAGTPENIHLETMTQAHHLGTVVPLALVQAFADDLEGNKGKFLVTGGGLALNPMAEYSAMSIANAAKRALVLTLFEHFRKRFHVGTVTISMMVSDNDTASRVADQFMALYQQEPHDWQAEINYSE